MRQIPILAAIAVVALILARTAQHREDVRILDRKNADYLEDEQTGRQLADLGLRLVARRGEVRLELQIAAQGPTVQPVPGFRGVHGANHITARELTEMLDRGQLKVVVLPRDGKGKRFGTVTALRRGRVPERRLDGDQLVVDAESLEEYVLAIHAESPVLAKGEHEVYVEAKGVPRLRVDVRVGATSGRILAVTSLGGHNIGEMQ